MLGNGPPAFNGNRPPEAHPQGSARTFPTHVPTPATEGFVTPEQYEQRAKAIPLRRNGTPEDVAKAAAFLLSDEAAFINGAMLAIDGGIIAAG